MKKLQIISFALAWLLAFASASLGHPGHHHTLNVRVWKDVDGRFEIEASFVVAKEGQVQLRKHDGALVWIPLAKLSAGDREWTQIRLGDIQRLNALANSNESATDPLTSPGRGSLRQVAGGFVAFVAAFLTLVVLSKRGKPV